MVSPIVNTSPSTTTKTTKTTNLTPVNPVDANASVFVRVVTAIAAVAGIGVSVAGVVLTSTNNGSSAADATAIGAGALLAAIAHAVSGDHHSKIASVISTVSGIFTSSTSESAAISDLVTEVEAITGQIAGVKSTLDRVPQVSRALGDVQAHMAAIDARLSAPPAVDTSAIADQVIAKLANTAISTPHVTVVSPTSAPPTAPAEAPGIVVPGGNLP